MDFYYNYYGQPFPLFPVLLIVGEVEHTQTMFLVPQHQLELLKRQQQQHNTGSIRQAAQNELDKAMVDVLQLPDLDMYEKAKKYAGILQRYLSLGQHGQHEKSVLTLSLPVTESDDAGGTRQDAAHPVNDINEKEVWGYCKI